MQNAKPLRQPTDCELAAVIAISALPRAEFRAALRQIKPKPQRPTSKAIGFGKGAA
jgi:hypothetical protein